MEKNDSNGSGNYVGDHVGEEQFAPPILGTYMTMKLGDDDGHAVDLLLDREEILVEEGNTQRATDRASAHPRFHQRMQYVEQWLMLLRQLPADEPPHDLTGRTLRRLEESLSSQPSPRPIA